MIVPVFIDLIHSSLFLGCLLHTGHVEANHMVPTLRALTTFLLGHTVLRIMEV